MLAAGSLLASPDPLVWAAALRAHDSRLAAFAAAKGKPALVALDSWVQNDLPSALGAGLQRLTRQLLSNAMRWKLLKGKNRPRLQSFVDGLPEAACAQAGAAAAAALARGDVGGALSALSDPLKGVGPATASLIISAADPSIPFMSDEALTAVLGTRKYTLAEALALTKRLRAKAAALNATVAEDPAASTVVPSFSANTLQLALWSHAHAGLDAQTGKGGKPGGSGKQAGLAGRRGEPDADQSAPTSDEAPSVAAVEQHAARPARRAAPDAVDASRSLKRPRRTA